MIKIIVSLVELAVAIVTLMLVISIYFTTMNLMAQMTSEYSNMFNFFSKLTSKFVDSPQPIPFLDPNIDAPIMDGFKN